MNNCIKLTVVFVLSLITRNISAQQITTTAPNITPVEAVEDILLGAGINAFNITYNGSGANANTAQTNVQEFDATGTAFPIETGVLMSSNGTGLLNDPDLDMLANDVMNGAIIEFDFIPTGDTLSFNYIFASSEYDLFTCSDFNDVFAFFLSGPGITGPFSNNAVNIATVPNSNNIPVAINTVNAGTNSDVDDNCFDADPNWQSNSIYFTTGYNTLFTNSDEPMSGVDFDPAFNGGTVVLPATADLICGDTFHIKLAIANDFDETYTSGVFLEAKSFKSNVIQISSDAGASVNVLDSILVEDCSEGSISFIRPEGADPNDTIVAPLIFSGTATQGDDFPQLSPGDSIVLLPGQDTITLSIIPTDDGMGEGIEDLTITTYSISVCGDTVFSNVVFYIADSPPGYGVTVNDTALFCSADSAFLYTNIQNGFAPYTYEWSSGDTGQSIWYGDLSQGSNQVIVTSTGACGFEASDTSFITLDQTLAIDTMIQFPSACGESTGTVSGQATGQTGTPDYQWSGPGPNSPDSYGASVWQNLPSGWYYFSIEDDVCFVEDSIFLEQDPPPTAAFTANPPVGNAPLDVTLTNESDPAQTYEWDFGNGDNITVNNLDDQFVTYTEEGVYTVTLTVTDGSCSDQATQQIVVDLEIPLYYDMPNVFTPNNDGSNDVFTLNTVNAVTLEIVIVNRWGNVVFESTDDVNAVWNGKVQNSGLECKDGTYFYQFSISGDDGEVIEEHGFVQLVRD